MRWAAVPVMLWAGAVAAEPVMLEGRVAWREQLMLPSGATTQVRLLDTATGAAVAEATLEGMRAPPVPFELSYDSAAVSAGGAYALDARITLGEQVLFATTQPQPVPDPARSQVVMLVVRLAKH